MASFSHFTLLPLSSLTASSSSSSSSTFLCSCSSTSSRSLRSKFQFSSLPRFLSKSRPKKMVADDFQLSDLPEINCLLITQSLDDHCHLKTLRPLSEKSPNLRTIATPNAKELLDPLFRNVTYLEPEQTSDIEASNDSRIRVKATAGPALGPPWQRPENGGKICRNKNLIEGTNQGMLI